MAFNESWKSKSTQIISFFNVLHPLIVTIEKATLAQLNNKEVLQMSVELHSPFRFQNFDYQ